MKTDSLSNKAYDLLKQRLLTADQGAFISARQFASDLNMSYTPVREAFLRLTKEGLLELIPNVGFFTPKIETKDIVEIFQVRECLELFVLRKVFNVITDGHIEALKEINEKQREKLDSNDMYGYINADEEFHMLFMKIYDNQHIIKLYKNIREEYFVCSHNIAVQHSEEAIDEHGALIDCIMKKDMEGAVSALGTHIEKTKQRIKEGFIRILD